jgi:hypothetical protein
VATVIVFLPGKLLGGLASPESEQPIYLIIKLMELHQTLKIKIIINYIFPIKTYVTLISFNFSS